MGNTEKRGGDEWRMATSITLFRLETEQPKNNGPLPLRAVELQALPVVESVA